MRHEAKEAPCRRLDLPCAAIPRNALGALTRVFVLQPREHRADTVVEHFAACAGRPRSTRRQLVRHFDDDCPVADRDRKSLHGEVRRQRERPAGSDLESGAVTRTDDDALLGLHTLRERAVVVRAAILDGVERPAAVVDADVDGPAETSFIDPAGSSSSGQTSISIRRA